MEFKDPFVSIHTHSHSSRFDGYGTEEHYAERLNEISQSAVAMTEHGNLGGLYEAMQVFEKKGPYAEREGDPIKLVPGIEAYLADDAEVKELTKEERKTIKARYVTADEAAVAIKTETRRRQERDHITIWALDDEGLHNLMRLSSWSWLSGYYGKPRIDIKRLKQFRKGLAVSTGCPGGIVTSPLRKGNVAEAVSRMKALAEIFGDRLYAEIMPHVPKEMPDLASRIVRLSKQYGATVVATQDAHYARASDATIQESLLCIHTGDRMSNPPGDGPGQRFAFDAHNYWLRTRAEMEEAFRSTPSLEWHVVQRALDETMAFAERCTAKLAGSKAGSYLVAPDLPPEFQDYEAWAIDIMSRNVHRKLGRSLEELPAHYHERLDVEFERLSRYGFFAYLISVWDVIEFCKRAGILTGPGRGSSAGSLTCYLMDITQLDPIRHHLSFDRFVAPLPEVDIVAGKASLPDIDTDVQKSRRSEVIDYLRAKYGEDRVALIRTHNTFGGKQALNDCARIHGVPQIEVLPVTSLIVTAVEEEAQDDASLKEILEGTDPGRAFAERYPDVAAQAVGLEGQIRAGRSKRDDTTSQSQGGGTHAAGIVVSPVPLVDLVPLESVKRKGLLERMPIIAFDMKAVEKMGLVKQDWLGLEALDWIAGALEEVDVDLEKIPLDDPATLDAFTQGRFTGIFQFDTPSARRLTHDFTFTRFADVAVMTALNRPGPMKSGMAQAYIDRSLDPTLVPELHPAVAKATATTRGVIVYQEQLVAIAADLCGYTPVEAQKFRKKIAKKEGVSDEEKHFVEGAVEHGGMGASDALELFNQVKEYAAYCFNSSHAHVYGLIGFWQMWLKVYHSAAFFAGALAYEPDRVKQARLAGDAKNYGIIVSPPEISASSSHFAIRRMSGRVEIVGSASDIKGIGPTASKAIARCRPYASLRDFCARTSDQRVTSKTFELLVRATAFREHFPNQRFLVENAKMVWKALKKGLVPVITTPDGYADYSEDERIQIASEVYPMYLDERGLGVFDLLEAQLRKESRRDLFVPGDPMLSHQSSALVFGVLAGARVFQGDDASRSGRLQIVSSSGEEIMARVPNDVLVACGKALKPLGGHIVAVVTTYQGNIRAEAFWSIGDVLNNADATTTFVHRPNRTRPKSPGRLLAVLCDGAVAEVEGVLIRKRIHRDRRGREMATLGILASNGYCPVLVFAHQWEDWPKRRTTVGAKIRLRVEKLEQGTTAAKSKPEWLAHF